MNRRNFIEKSTVLGTALGLGIPHIAMTTKPKLKLGLQLFSVRDAMVKNPLECLQKLKALGYEDFETYGFDTANGTLYGYSVADFKSVLEDLNLTTTSGHYGFMDYIEASPDSLARYVDQCIEAATRLQSSYLTWPFVSPLYRNAEGFKRLANRLNEIGAQVAQAGLGFAYHNHGYEFENWSGTTGHQILMTATDADLVKLQMDLYWVIHSGESPKALVADQPGRYVMWHIKDMDKVTRDYSELGNGSIDYTAELPDPNQSGLEYYYLEQGGNYAVNSMQSATDSIRYFKKNLQSLL